MIDKESFEYILRNRAASVEAERELVREILRTRAGRDERVREWVERTGKSERAFYRRRAELESG